MHLYISLYISMSPHTSICFPYIMGTFWGELYICQTFLCLSLHPFAPQFITVIPATHYDCGSFSVPICSEYCFFLHYLTGWLQMYVQAHAVDLFLFFVVLHFVSSFCYHGYNHYSSCDSCVLQYFISLYNQYHGPLLDGASSKVGSVWYGIATTTDTEGLLWCCWPCHCATAATSVSDASSGLCQLCHGSSTCKFLSQSWASHHPFTCIGVCPGMLSVFRCHAGCHIHLWGLNHWGLHHCSILELSNDRHMCNLVMIIATHQECTEWLLHPLFWVEGSLLLLNQLSSSHCNCIVEHTALGA